ncbi:phosphate/phosphite/phosphonate ABC transporter substrate-binding protein [Ammoniphilus sp. CFH 90114]|uniref:phosphate/phosphite/phosphonate ABC transporter substrate-binding protein n=1 Tax=Ammoniphilus sp. CFH 90114 TaxID=2493665 RepID=UPI00100E564B|nr:phosphate/phosphite/phosphonate ABC transporter substrate-binding protein [Ammoniphilus sp. CFH 90114]RXT14935.1 phosphate/phosphite/phosphonate ABC transporter substrate-binding protein [Ammoniphilus sp. CFH 90114]
MFNQVFRGISLSLILILLLTACGGGPQQAIPDQPAEAGDTGKTPSLTIGVIPSLNQGKMQEAIKKLGSHLEQEVGIAVKIDVYPDYNGVVEAMNFGQVNMAYYGPLTYVIAHHESGAEAIMTQLVKGEPYYYSYIIAHKDSPYNSLDEMLNDKEQVTFAFGDPNSTSGSLIPGLELKDRGVYRNNNDHDFKNVIFTGGHDATALAVENKQVDAGAIDSAIFDTLKEGGKINGDLYKVIWQSEKLFQYPWAVKDVDQETVSKIQEAFLKVTDQDILDAFAATGFTKAQNSDYEAIRRAAEQDGRLK